MRESHSHQTNVNMEFYALLNLMLLFRIRFVPVIRAELVLRRAQSIPLGFEPYRDTRTRIIVVYMILHIFDMRMSKTWVQKYILI